MFNPRAFKTKQRDYWDAAADEFDHGFGALIQPMIHELVAAAGLQPGDRVLELACGTGAGAFAAARVVGPTGSVVGLDISPRMVERANGRAARRDCANAKFVVGDAEQLALPDRSFDAVICQLGVALFPNAVAALTEAKRVVEPGRHVVMTAMGRAVNSPFLVLPARIAAKHLPTVVLSEGGPTQLQYAADGALEAVFAKAGFANVWTRRFVLMISIEDAGSYWDLFRRGVGGFAYRLARERQADQDKVIAEIKAEIGKHISHDGLRLPLEIVMSGGTRPAEPGQVATGTRELATRVDRARRRVRVVGTDAIADFRARGVVIDVRQPEELAAGHVEGARNLPRGRLELDIAGVAPDVRTPILCCGDPVRAALAGDTLVAMGYRTVAVLDPGGAA